MSIFNFRRGPKADQTVNREYKQKNSETIIGKINLKPNCLLWEFNLKTNKIGPATYEEEITLNLKSDKKYNKKLINNPKCIYVKALTKEKAKRKIEKIINEKMNSGIVDQTELEKRLIEHFTKE